MRGLGRLEFPRWGLGWDIFSKVPGVSSWRLGRLAYGPRGAGQVGQEPKGSGGRMHLEFNMTLKVRGRFWFI